MPLAAEFHALGLGEPIAGLRRAGPRHRRPARPPRRRRCPRARSRGGGRGRRPPRADRPPERRQVEHGQPHPRRRARDRLRGRRHHARRDRPAVRVRRTADSILVDTAGLRRQAKVGDSIEYYTALRSPPRGRARRRRARRLRRGRRRDRRRTCAIAELAMQSGCATALVLNKWDLTGGEDQPEVDLDHERARVAQKLRLRPRVLTASALTGRHVQRLLRRGDGARRPHLRPHPDAAAQPLPLRDPGDPPAAGEAEPPPQAAST